MSLVICWSGVATQNFKWIASNHHAHVRVSSVQCVRFKPVVVCISLSKEQKRADDQKRLDLALAESADQPTGIRGNRCILPMCGVLVSMVQRTKTHDFSDVVIRNACINAAIGFCWLTFGSPACNELLYPLIRFRFKRLVTISRA